MADQRRTDAPDDDETLRESGQASELDLAHILRASASPAARRGLISLIAGILIFAWPRATTSVIVATVAVAAVLTGVSDLIAMVRHRSPGAERIRSILMVVAGGFILFVGRESFPLLALALAALLIGRGLVDVWSAVRSSGPRSDRTWRTVRGVAQVLVGIITAISPKTVVLVVIAAMAVSWIVAGLMNLLHAFNLDESDDAPIDPRQTPQAVVDWLRKRDMGPAGRRAVTEKIVFEGREYRTRVSRFAALMLFSTAIATFGVQGDSTAVVIGAMLIAPLMTPIMATAASLLMGWPGRALRSAGLVAMGVGLAIGTSWILAKYTPDLVAVTANSQILSRVTPTMLDLLVAVAAGGAGAYAVSRVDVSDSLPGVAIAVALVPPLTVVGISLEAGDPGFAAGAFLLFTTNLVGIILAAGLVFVLVGYSPWFHLEAHQEQVNRSFATVGVAMLVIAIPLSITGDSIVSDLAERSAVEATVDAWLGSDTAFDVAQVGIDGGSISVVAVGAGDPPAAEELAAMLADRLDRPVELDLRIIPERRTSVTGVP